MKLATSRRIRWTTADYFRMAAAGLFEGRRVELIEGEVIRVAAQATPHRAAITTISRLLLAAFDPGANWVVIQGTLVLPPRSAPDPDFHVLAAPVGTPDDKLPRPLLLIEVSDSTYKRDSGSKLRLYARAGIDDYWIVNLSERRVEVYRRPENLTGHRSGWGYADVQFFGIGQKVQTLHRPDLQFAVDAMLP